MEDSKAGWHTISIRVPFASEEHAIIAQRVINVDKELQSHAVERVLEVQDKLLIVTFRTLTVRLARLTVNSFLENIDLVVRTIGEFGEDAARYNETSSNHSTDVTRQL